MSYRHADGALLPHSVPQGWRVCFAFFTGRDLLVIPCLLTGATGSSQSFYTLIQANESYSNAKHCSVAFGAFLLCPQFTSTPRIVGGLKRGNVNAVPKTTAHAAAGRGRTDTQPFGPALPVVLQRHMCGGEKEAKPRRYRERRPGNG